MSLLGKKCARCGKRTRDEFQNQPTCDACKSEMQLAIAESSEAKRNCPADGTLLQKQVAYSVIIDKCPTCGGVWLDSGELERIDNDVITDIVIGMSVRAY